MNHENYPEGDLHKECLNEIRRLTEQRDQLLESTERLLAIMDRLTPSLEGMMELDDIRAAVANARGEAPRKLSGRMIEIPIEKFYKFDLKLHQDKYAIEVDTAARYGCFEHDDLGDEHGGSLRFERRPGGGLALAGFDGVAALPDAVLTALERQGIAVDEKFRRELAPS